MSREEFFHTFGREPQIYSAPGRVNLIGEHTDYNDGFVLPMAIDRRTSAAIAPREDNLIRCESTGFDGRIEFELAPDLKPANDWANHVRGIAAMLIRDEFDLRGADILINGDLPIGAGLGSSAAIEVAVGYALLKNSEQPVDLVDLALAAQRAEQEFTGTQSGIMDQYIACLGVKGHALLIDCRSLEYRAIPINSEKVSVVICDSMVKHDLASSEYNQRRAECAEGVRRLSSLLPDLTSLRDVEIEDFDHYAESLPETIRRRCNHVLTENARTLAAVDAISNEDLDAVGRLMFASHQSLKVDYEVTCRELDLLVEIASNAEGVYGARMTGGGFGGCTVNLVTPDRVDQFIDRIIRTYHDATGLTTQCYVCSASGGVG